MNPGSVQEAVPTSTPRPLTAGSGVAEPVQRLVHAPAVVVAQRYRGAGRLRAPPRPRAGDERDRGQAEQDGDARHQPGDEVEPLLRRRREDLAAELALEVVQDLLLGLALVDLLLDLRAHLGREPGGGDVHRGPAGHAADLAGDLVDGERLSDRGDGEQGQGDEEGQAALHVLSRGVTTWSNPLMSAGVSGPGT